MSNLDDLNRLRDRWYSHGARALDDDDVALLLGNINALNAVIREIRNTLRKFHVPGGEQYDVNNPVDAEYLANHLDKVLKEHAND